VTKASNRNEQSGHKKCRTNVPWRIEIKINTCYIICTWFEAMLGSLDRLYISVRESFK